MSLSTTCLAWFPIQAARATYKVEVENIVLGRTEKEIVKHRGEESAPVLHELNQRATEMLRKFRQKKVKCKQSL